jgi:hypothetical protein
VDWVSPQPIFSAKGVFDDAFYKRYVNEYLRVSPRDFEEEIRELLAIQKVQERVRSKIQITEDELRNAYARENSDKKIVYGVALWESAKLGENDKAADEQSLSQIYSIVKDKLTEPERVKLAFIFIPTDKKDSLKAALEEKDATLEALAAKYQLEIKETASFSKNDAVPEIGLSKEVLRLAFSLGVGNESSWLNLDKGSYKIKVVSKTAERALTKDESKAQLEQLLIKQKATEILIKKLNELKPKMETAGFEETLKAEGIEAKTLDNFKKDDYIAGVGPSSLFEKKLSEMKEGQISDAFSVPTGAAMLKLIKTSAIDEKKYSSEKDDFRRKLLDKKTETEMAALLEKLRSKLVIDVETMKKLFAEE